MLKAMRDGAKSGFLKIILFGFMSLAVGGLVLTDVGGFFTGGGISNNSVAEVANVDLPITVFDSRLQRMLNQQGLDTKTAYQLGIIQRELHGEVRQQLLQAESRALGIAVPNRYIAARIRELVASQVTEEISEKQAFEALLRSQRITEDQYTQGLRAQIATTLVQGAISGAAIEDNTKEASTLYQYENEKRSFSYHFFPHSRIQKVAKAPEEALLALYEASKHRHSIPETRSFKIGTFDAESLIEKPNITEEMMRAYYDKHLEDAYFDRDETRSIKQAIFETQEEALTFYDIIKNISAGTDIDMSAIAEENNLSDNAIINELTDESQNYIEQLRSEVFNATKGQILAPTASPIGFHVIQLTDITEPYTRPYEEVKDIIKAELTIDFENRQAEQLFAQINDIDEAVENGEKIAEISKTITLKQSDVKSVPLNGDKSKDNEALKEFSDKDRDEVLSAAFTLEENETSGVLELDNNKFILIEITDITPLSYKTYEQVKPQIQKQWKQDQKASENKLQTSAMLKDFIAGNKPEISFEKKTLKRNDEIEHPLSEDIKKRLFESYVGDYIMGENKKGYVIARIDGIQIPKVPKQNETLDAIKAAVYKTTQNEIYEMFMRSLYTDHKVVINEKLLESTYGTALEE
jgi:peptidyl-prolyl cis-trans isomerase D